MEPAPENVEGRVEHSFQHEVSHRVNWGYVAVGIGALIAAYWLRTAVSDDEEEQGQSGALTGQP